MAYADRRLKTANYETQKESAMRSRCTVKIGILSGWSAFVLAIVALLTSGALQAQSNVSLTGKVTALKGQDLTVATANGPAAVKLNDKTVIRGELPIKFSDITPGMYVGATAAKQPDGTFLASRLHVFSEDQRGTGEGHRPLSSAPGSGLTMTNANVETVEDVAVQNVRGRLLLLKFKGGEIKVLVPADTLVVKRVIADSQSLKPGATLSITANRADDGVLTARQITVRAQ
jgi:Domain of unknown function (DUF5666)